MFIEKNRIKTAFLFRPIQKAHSIFQLDHFLPQANGCYPKKKV